MHGLINRAFQCFVQDIYGVAAWQAVIRGSDLPLADFEPMATYDDQVTDTVIATAADVLGRPRGTLLEDMGTYLVNHDNLISLRRLLRFSGVNFFLSRASS